MKRDAQGVKGVLGTGQRGDRKGTVPPGGQCWEAGASPSTDLPNPIGKACTTRSDFATHAAQRLDRNNSK